jgi:hypothetical protein
MQKVGKAECKSHYADARRKGEVDANQTADARCMLLRRKEQHCENSGM